MSSEPLQITNEDERRFTIRLLRKDEKLGDDDRVFYEQDEPSLEFFDASGFDSEEEQHIMGYFTGIRCPISELFVVENDRSIDFREHLAIWNISERSIACIQIWLLHQLNEAEKEFVRTLPLFSYIQTFIEVDSVIEQLDEADDEMAALLRLHRTSPPPTLPPPEPAEEDEQTHHTDFVQQELEEAMRALDLAEAAENQWKQGDVKLRLRILAAKRQTLKAIALLNKRDDDVWS
jgi:hypothetical protein